jgi:hypothetical protein
MTCPHCGRENETTQKFCGSCGRPLLLTCSSCGNTSSLDFRFCGSCGADLRPVLPTVHTGEERRVVTVLFADLVGFTSRAERLDPEDVRALLDPYYACLRDAIQAFGGQVEKYVGDAVMGVFGSPQNTITDASVAAACCERPSESPTKSAMSWTSGRW